MVLLSLIDNGKHLSHSAVHNAWNTIPKKARISSIKSTEVYARTSVNIVTVYTNGVINKMLTIDYSNVHLNKIISEILV